MFQLLKKYNYLHDLGEYLIMMKHAFSRPEKLSMYWKETARQMNDIGIGSLLIVCLISIFIGAVAALQFAYQLDGQLVPRYYIGYIVRDLALIELSPTITGLVLAGKVGSNMAAEIGGMRQKEHIDAMEVNFLCERQAVQFDHSNMIMHGGRDEILAKHLLGGS